MSSTSPTRPGSPAQSIPPNRSILYQAPCSTIGLIRSNHPPPPPEQTHPTLIPKDSQPIHHRMGWGSPRLDRPFRMVCKSSKLLTTHTYLYEVHSRSKWTRSGSKAEGLMRSIGMTRGCNQTTARDQVSLGTNVDRRLKERSQGVMMRAKGYPIAHNRQGS